jgi:hypothetical protein
MCEYKRIDIKFTIYRELVEELNKNGNEGWEVIFYEEEKPEKFGDKFNAKTLFKRLKEFPA